MKQRFPFSYEQIETEIGDAVKKYATQTDTEFTEEKSNLRKAPDRLLFEELKTNMMAIGAKLMQDPLKQKALEAVIVRDFNVENASEVKFHELTEIDYDRMTIFYNDMLELDI